MLSIWRSVNVVVDKELMLELKPGSVMENQLLASLLPLPFTKQSQELNTINKRTFEKIMEKREIAGN